MKKLALLFTSTLLATAVSSAAFASDYSGMYKQLNIMSDIIKSSVVESNRNGNSKISNISSTYLKGQGIVFTINTGSKSRHWGDFNFNFGRSDIPLPPVPPIPPILSIDAEDLLEFDVNETVSHAMESAAEGWERAMEVLHSTREAVRDLHEEQRELSYDARDVQRAKRDITYQLKRADEESKKELEAELKKLDKQNSLFENVRKELDTKIAELRKKQQIKAKEQLVERAAYYKSITTVLAETFCSYGNGLKALPGNENVSVILKSAGEKNDRRYKDKIFVFSKKDISACTMDKINAAQLLAKGNEYQF